MSEATNYFKQLAAVNVSEHLEKKGAFSYLSWPYAVAQLRLAHPAATWEVKRFDGLPFLATDLGVFVEVAVTVEGISLSQIHPVLDSKNRPIMAPTSFDINTSIQRCLVKAIALHGLGLSIYAGEDLPMTDGSAPAIATAAPAAAPQKVTTLPVAHPGEAMTASQERYIQKLIDETGTQLQKVLDYFGISQLQGISKTEASRVIRSLEQSRNRKEAA